MVRKQFIHPRKGCRLPYWTYSKRQVYYITILTRLRYRYFGEYVDRKLLLSEAGIIARDLWLTIPHHFPYITLDEFVFMPDHMHGILIINRELLEEDKLFNGDAGGATGIHNPMLHDNISRVIRWYKGRATYEIRRMVGEFKWHGRFYDRILRKNELVSVRRYIRTNPDDWQRWL